MPKCSDNGPGWSGEYPNCTYTTPGAPTPGEAFDPDVPVQEDEFWGDIFEGDKDVSYDFIKSQFDPYDPFEEEMLMAEAATDIGQLRDAWGMERGQLRDTLTLAQGQLRETWGLEESQLGETFALGREARGMTTGREMRDVRGQALQAMSRSGLATSGTIGGIQRGQERDIMGAYGFGEREAKSTYEQRLEEGRLGMSQAIEEGQLMFGQAIETGKFGLETGITDIGQGLEADIYDVQEDWEEEMQQQLQAVEEEDAGCTGDKPVMCPDGTCRAQECECPGGTCQKQGCMDRTASNYDSDATIEDGSCNYAAGTEGYETATEEVQKRSDKAACEGACNKPSGGSGCSSVYNRGTKRCRDYANDLRSYRECMAKCAGTYTPGDYYG